MEHILTASGISISYQDEGNKHAPVIILIIGLGAQYTVWPDSLYYGLVEKGFRVIRFDNRDAGLSSKLDEFGNPSLLKHWLSRRFPIRANLPYSLDDMARDVKQFMNALGIKKAHLVGASMGGMIAQIAAAKYKKRVLSLTSIMSSSSPLSFSSSNINLLVKLAKIRPRSSNKQAAIEYNVRLNQLIGSPAYPQDEHILYANAERYITRADNNQKGFKRQLAAIAATPYREQLLKKTKAPTLVIHGSADPVMPLSAGINTALLIKRSKLRVVPGMGHDFPPALMKKITKWISKHAYKASQKSIPKAKHAHSHFKK